MKQDKIRAIIIDDDPLFREHLKDLLSTHVKQAELLDVCDGPEAGIAAIAKHHPQLVFLDVEMPEMNGFEMLKRIKNINFEIIFTTAYDYYAIRAIRFAAIDYLVKPIQADMLQEAFERVKEKIYHKTAITYAAPVAELKPANETALANIAVPTLDGFLLRTEDIVRCEADDRYSKLFTVDKKMIFASRTLGDFEDLLLHSGFVRIHNVHLINLRHLKKYIKGEGGQVVMSDGSTLDVSRRKKDILLASVPHFK